MGRVWVLDTETKGTGAEMVPLEKLRRGPAPRVEPLFVPPKRKPREPKPPEPRPSLRFRIVDVMTRAVLAGEGAPRGARDVLNGVASIVAVHVFLWQPEARKWRRLTLEEQRTLWERRA